MSERGRLHPSVGLHHGAAAHRKNTARIARNGGCSMGQPYVRMMFLSGT